MIRTAASYIAWHYSRSISEFLGVWGNFMWFFWHFFSIGILLQTLFQPLNRLNEGYKKGLYPEAWFETFVVNSLMRVVGLVVRLTIIIIGVFALVCAAIFGAILFVAWLFAPFVWALVLVAGMGLLFL